MHLHQNIFVVMAFFVVSIVPLNGMRITLMETTSSIEQIKYEKYHEFARWVKQRKTPSWANTFNSNISETLWWHIENAKRAATSAEYPFFTWNGWVYDTESAERITLVEHLR
jgi:hypothetical protein